MTVVESCFLGLPIPLNFAPKTLVTVASASFLLLFGIRISTGLCDMVDRLVVRFERKYRVLTVVCDVPVQEGNKHHLVSE